MDMRGIFLSFLLVVGGVLGVSERAGTARFDFRYIDRPCAGNNGLEPGAVKEALEARGIPNVTLEVPAKAVELCDGCYPNCDCSDTYTAVVPKKYKKTARQVLDGLVHDVPTSPLELPVDAKGVVLSADANCTREACPAGDSCCHSCAFRGWRVDERREVRAFAGEGKLPACVLDGCGMCDFALVADGHYSQRYFVVHAFTKR